MSFLSTALPNHFTMLTGGCGESVTYSANGGAGASVTGVWEDGDGMRGTGDHIADFEDRTMRKHLGIFHAKTSDIATVTPEADTITRGGRTYTVKHFVTRGGIHSISCAWVETDVAGRRARRFER